MSDGMNHTGLTDEQAQEVHATFMRGVVFWAGTAALAHLLVWSWLPWFPTS
ncbi:MAG: light-harvesting antenna LH1, beta subunit [Pseudomonadota bacterium]